MWQDIAQGIPFDDRRTNRKMMWTLRSFDAGEPPTTLAWELWLGRRRSHLGSRTMALSGGRVAVPCPTLFRLRPTKTSQKDGSTAIEKEAKSMRFALASSSLLSRFVWRSTPTPIHYSIDKATTTTTLRASCYRHWASTGKQVPRLARIALRHRHGEKHKWVGTDIMICSYI